MEITLSSFFQLSFVEQCNILNHNVTWFKVTCTALGGLDQLRMNLLMVRNSITPVCLKEDAGICSFYIKYDLNNIAIKNFLRYLLSSTSECSIAFDVEPPFDPKLNPETYMMGVLNRRYNMETKTFNLSNLKKDPDLLGLIDLPLSCLLSQEKWFFLMKELKLCDENLNLSNNEIRTLTKHFPTKHYKTLDLSSNLIVNIDDLTPLSPFKIDEIILDNNPLCATFADTISYTRKVVEILPSLKILDGVCIDNTWNKYCCSLPCFTITEGAQHVTDEFLSTFFNIYDSQNRNDLKELYSNDAVFSLTCDFNNKMTRLENSDLVQYKNIQRNILRISDISNFHKKIFRGSKAIIDVFNNLPRTEHEPCSFTVDVMYHMFSRTVIIVGGIFRHTKSAVFRFTRVFTLKSISYSKFFITNDLWHVHSASEGDIASSFKDPIRKFGDYNLIDPSYSDQEKLISIFSHLTDLKRIYARRRLADKQWDIKPALALFLDDMENGLVSDNFFNVQLDAKPLTE